MMATLGRSWKIVVLAATVLGAVGFFAPFRRYVLGEREIQVTPYRMLIGYSDVAQIAPELAARSEEARAVLLERWNDLVRHETMVTWEGREFSVMNRVPLYFLSVIACGLAAAIAFARRLGLFTGLLVVAGGLCALWGWSRELLLSRAASSAAGREVLHTGWGVNLALACGLLALVAGIGSLLIQDPGKKRPRVRIVVDGEAREIEVDEPKTSVPVARLRKRG
jgi:hypothetical protein